MRIKKILVTSWFSFCLSELTKDKRLPIFLKMRPNELPNKKNPTRLSPTSSHNEKSPTWLGIRDRGTRNLADWPCRATPRSLPVLDPRQYSAPTARSWLSPRHGRITSAEQKHSAPNPGWIIWLRAPSEANPAPGGHADCFPQKHSILRVRSRNNKLSTRVFCERLCWLVYGSLEYW